MKTLQSILAYLIFKNQEPGIIKNDIPCLVVCKSTLKYQWVNEGINKFTDCTSLVIDGTKKKRQKLYDSISNSSPEFILIGYETLREDIDIVSKLKIGVTIFDEAHKIRNKDTLLNKNIRKIKTDYCLSLTGSPINGHPDGMYGICLIGNKKIFGAWKEFCNSYLKYRKSKFGNELYGYKNLDKFKDIVDNISLRRTAEEIGAQMPSMTIQNIYLDMSKNQLKIDEELKIELSKTVEEINHIKRNANVTRNMEEKLTKLGNKIKMFIALRTGLADTLELFLMSKSPVVKKNLSPKITDVKSNKLEYLKEHIREIMDSGHKVVVFTKFETMTRIIKRELDNMKINSVLFTGQMNSKQQEQAKILFNTSNNYNVFIGTNAAAEGLNLQTAKYLINFDLDWDQGINDQRNKRIKRLNSAFDKVFVYNYISRTSIDEEILHSLDVKQSIFDYLINNDVNKSNQLNNTLNNY